MSYVRFGEDDSDVYVYLSVPTSGYLREHLTCCGCSIAQEYVAFMSTQGMVDHLMEHRAFGDCVPEWVFEELRADDAENFPVDGDSEKMTRP